MGMRIKTIASVDAKEPSQSILRMFVQRESDGFVVGSVYADAAAQRAAKGVRNQKKALQVALYRHVR